MASASVLRAQASPSVFSSLATVGEVLVECRRCNRENEAVLCRAFFLLQHMSEAALHKYGFDVREHMLKICQDLRPPLGTEPQTAAAVHCPGQCLISTQSKMVMLERNDAEGHNSAATAEEKQVVVYK